MMRFNISKDLEPYLQAPVVGNVYNVRGGNGAKKGYMMVIVSIVDTTCTVLTITKEGEVIGGTNYGTHYFEDKCPIAFSKNLETLSFEVETL